MTPERIAELRAARERAKDTLEPANWLDLLDALEEIEALRRCVNCRQCAQIVLDRGFGPRHDGSPFCESGSIAAGGDRAHCTCDACF